MIAAAADCVRAFGVLARFVTIAAAVLGAGCESDIGEPLADVPVTVVSYNLAGADGLRADAIAAHIEQLAPAFVAAQECYACDELMARLPPRYRRAGEPSNGVAVIYDGDQFELAASDVLALSGNDDGWGVRYAALASLSHRPSGGLFTLVSTHWCVSIRTDSDACTSDSLQDYAARTVELAASAAVPAETVVIAGDFNVFGDFEGDPALGVVRSAGYRDVFRELHPSDPGDTFGGNDWAPPGRLDYIFAADALTARDATVERDAVPAGEGSDHFAVTATLEWAP